ncbi:hypothetical protein Ddc_14335 [Ditylenchus destructor]|nr:hypothetical protein Ddc_14335 [Ditylenchus destructor]
MQIAKYIKLAKGAKIRNALAHTLSIFRHHPKLTVAATGLAAVSAAIATGISAYIDEMDAGKDSSNHPAVAALDNFFPIRCRIYSNQFMMTFEDFNLEYFKSGWQPFQIFSKVKSSQMSQKECKPETPI